VTAASSESSVTTPAAFNNKSSGLNSSVKQIFPHFDQADFPPHFDQAKFQADFPAL
jgi:hypothetical protein